MKASSRKVHGESLRTQLIFLSWKGRRQKGREPSGVQGGPTCHFGHRGCSAGSPKDTAVGEVLPYQVAKQLIRFLIPITLY